MDTVDGPVQELTLPHFDRADGRSLIRASCAVLGRHCRWSSVRWSLLIKIIVMIDPLPASHRGAGPALDSIAARGLTTTCQW